MAHLYFTPNLARQVACPDQDIDAADVASLLQSYFAQRPEVRDYVLDDQGKVRKHIRIIVDGLNLRDRQGLSDALAADSEVYVFQALSGG
jgi:molybdopterin converting factor small subunit